MKKHLNYSAAVLLILLCLGSISCKKKKEADPVAVKNKYSTMLCVGSWPNTAYYISQFPSLTEGTIDLKGNGAEITSKVYAQDVIQKNGFYYHANFSAGKLGKYHVEDGVLITDQEIPFTYLNWSSYAWIGNETVVLFGTNGDQNEARYAILTVATMQVSTGVLDLEEIPTDFDAYMLGFAEYRGDKLYVGYGFGSTDYSNYPTMTYYQKALVATFNYPAMTLAASTEDTRTTGAGGPIVYAPCSFVDENNDLYFISDPVYNYDYTSPSAIYRIKSGSNVIDNSYYFDFSATVNDGKGPAMWYIGNGKAIIRTRVAGQSIDTDHSFSIVNVHTGAFVKTLDLPADKGERMVQAVVVEDGKAYIAVNSADRDFVYVYDPIADTLTKGVEIVGGVDYILRLEKLN